MHADASVIRYGRTALHWAAEHNKPASIEALVKMKADVNILTCAPLEVAKCKEHTDCIAVLLAAGAT